jgi:peptidoglycan hydrolase CwlO-like protein
MEKKKIKKSIESLEKQRQEHRAKIEDYDGKNYALLDYWKKEINSFDNKIEELKRRLEEKR